MSDNISFNLGYVFYNINIEDDSKNITDNVKKILNYNLSKNEDSFLYNTNFNKIFKDYNKNDNSKPTYEEQKLKTTYPGLLVGIGNTPMGALIDENNESQNNEGEIKTGFSFDYVTGLPYILGSTVKGIIRSRIKKYEKSILEWLKDEVKLENFSGNIDELINELFGSSKNTNVNKRDVFFDAVITSSGKIFEDDFITPHKNEYSGVNPIRILKIKEGVEITFRFLIRKNDILGIKADDRKYLYVNILKELGVGAKTNTGYGFLKE